MEIVPGPDFPTGAMILGRAGARSAYETGRGSIIVRSTYEIETGRGDRQSIVLTEIPYQTGKNGLVEKIAEAAKDKRDRGRQRYPRPVEPRRRAHRHRPEARRDARGGAEPAVAAHAGAIELPRQHARDPRRPARTAQPARHHQRLRRRSARRSSRAASKFELAKARERAHILLGLVIAVTNLDEVVRIIRGSSSPAEAREALLAREWPIAEIAPYIAPGRGGRQRGDRRHLSPVRHPGPRDPRPAPAPPHRAGPRRDRRRAEGGWPTSIAELLDILADRAKLYEVMRGELTAVRDEFATPRRTEIAAAADGIDDEDLIEREDMVVTVTVEGYIKRTPLDTFRAQKRGGKGRAGMATKDEDASPSCSSPRRTRRSCSSRPPARSIASRSGACPRAARRRAAGRWSTCCRWRPGETISTVLPLPEDEAEWGDLHVMFATAKGMSGATRWMRSPTSARRARSR